MATDRCEEKQILKDCKRRKNRIAPSGLAELVPMAITEPTPRRERATPALSANKAAVLIDDDALVHMTWKVAARSARVALKQFRNPADFFANYEGLSKDTTIYIDSDLGDGLKGEEIAQIIHSTGFKTIYLETGHQPDSFPSMPWIKEIISKEPPWSA